MSKEEFFPKFFDQKYLSQISYAIDLKTIDVIGTNFVENAIVKVEVYKRSSASKILGGITFTLNRLKDVHKKNKIEIFLNGKGQVIEQALYAGNCRSITNSFIEDHNTRYWGMHYERIILSDKLIDSLCFFDEIRKARKEFKEKKVEGCDVNKLFYLSTNEPKISIQLILDK